MYSNVRISDSAVTNEDYAKRATELNHGIISTSEHGWQGRYIEGYELAKKYNLKFLFGVEAYWVKDRLQPDRTNCHIFIAARNEKGRRAINNALSEACLTGFYGQPRLDIELILKLPPDDVIVTTACIAYWKYEDIEDITLRFFNHFKKNFFLEVQYHQTESQRNLNKNILTIANKYGIEFIMGCDSHCILQDDQLERLDFIESKGMKYDDEKGWFLDYPDGATAYKRFADQCVLSHEQIVRAMENTNVFLEVEEYDCSCFNKEIKMPTLYPNKTQEEKDQIYCDLIWAKWEEEKKDISQDLWSHYEEEIKKEIETVLVTKHSDYFLLDYEIIKRGKELGGVVTATGRGSGVSFFTNKLLGLTEVDRISAQVKMYPERFMSPTRILESKSLADLDMNLADPAPFAKAQTELLGDDHSYPMIAYGTMKPKAAWKMYAKSQNVDFATANAISQQINRYENAIKHADDEEEREQIDIYDFIDKAYHEVYENSICYQAVVVSSSIHPCSYLVYQGDIRSEIGLIRAKDTIVCVMDGKWAEDYKFLKNDLLTVSVVKVIQAVYDRIKVKRHTVRELLDLCPPDNKVWDIYKNGITLSINQCEQEGTKQRVMKYSPQNISELCAFVAAIRPGFKSMYKIFESKEHFEYSIQSLDELIQTPEMPHSFILYQEMSMAVLNYAGIPMSECYEIIKNIAKKRIEKVLKYKEDFLKNFRKVLIEKDKLTESSAEEMSKQIWQILEDSSRYSFNASHSYCVSLDSLYCAYLKTYYPIEFYEVILKIYDEKGKKDKMQEAQDEAEKFYGIKFPPYKYGQNNVDIRCDKTTNTIYNSLTAIKGFGRKASQKIYDCSKKESKSFIDLLYYLYANSIKKAMIEPLINIDYFDMFGNIPTLLEILQAFEFFGEGKSKTVKKEKLEEMYGRDEEVLRSFKRYSNDIGKNGSELKSYNIENIYEMMCDVADAINAKNTPDLSYKEKIKLQTKILGYTNITTFNPSDKRKAVIIKMIPRKSPATGDIWAYGILMKSLGTGVSAWITCRARLLQKDQFDVGDVIYCKNIEKTDRGFFNLLDWEIL